MRKYLKLLRTFQNMTIYHFKKYGVYVYIFVDVGSAWEVRDTQICVL